MINGYQSYIFTCSSESFTISTPKISCDFAMGGRQQHFPKRRWDAPASNPEKGRSSACACALNLGETWWNQFCFNQWWNPNRVQVLGPVNLWSSCQALLVNALEKKHEKIYTYIILYISIQKLFLSQLLWNGSDHFKYQRYLVILVSAHHGESTSSTRVPLGLPKLRPGT